MAKDGVSSVLKHIRILDLITFNQGKNETQFLFVRLHSNVERKERIDSSSPFYRPYVFVAIPIDAIP